MSPYMSPRSKRSPGYPGDARARFARTSCVIFVRIVSRAFALAVVSRHNLARVAEPVPGRNLVWLPGATVLPSRVDTVTSMNARLLPTFKTLASISTSSKPGRHGIGIARSGPRTRPGRGSRSRARRC